MLSCHEIRECSFTEQKQHEIDLLYEKLVAICRLTDEAFRQQYSYVYTIMEVRLVIVCSSFDRSNMPCQLTLVELTDWLEVLLLSLHQKRPYGITRAFLMRFRHDDYLLLSS
jgi:hypothetical protein